jgi:hypothetical protein
MMAKKWKTLEDTFGIEPAEDGEGQPSDDINVANDGSEPTEDDVKAALAMAEDIDRQLSAARGRDEHDDEMDELAKLAVQAHRDLQDLGMNVEIRHAGEIFSSSSQMLKIAVDAKNNKVEKKLRMLRLQLDKLKLDRSAKSQDSGNSIEGKAHILDRNELLKQLGDLDADAK